LQRYSIDLVRSTLRLCNKNIRADVISLLTDDGIQEIVENADESSIEQPSESLIEYPSESLLPPSFSIVSDYDSLTNSCGNNNSPLENTNKMMNASSSLSNASFILPLKPISEIPSNSSLSFADSITETYDILPSTQSEIATSDVFYLF
jgi:hypothetical protein